MTDQPIEDMSDDDLNAALQDQTEPDQADDLPQEGEDGEGDADRKPSVDVAKLERRLKDKEGAFKSERQKRQELERRVADMEARVQERQKAAPYDPLADISKVPPTDPIGKIEALERALAHYARQDQQAQTQTRAQQQQQANIQALANWAGEAEAEFRTDNPDYDDAATHFTKTRLEELSTLYSPQDAPKALERELIEIMARCRQSGRDPAEAVYTLAKKRGFKKLDAGSQTLDAVGRGQQASRSLSTTPGKSGEGTINPESLMKLSGAAFDAAWAKYERQQKKVS